MDECKETTDGCHINATCDNTIGSYTCECATGLTGNGTTCYGKYVHARLWIIMVFSESLQQKHKTWYGMTQIVDC